jgi:hypothetical protein
MPFTSCDYKNNKEMQITKKDLNIVEWNILVVTDYRSCTISVFRNNDCTHIENVHLLYWTDSTNLKIYISRCEA